jgi:type III secretion system YscQ/HrcQ family protein
MATWAEIKDNRISFLRIIVGFLPLAFGCFLSVLFQRIDSLVADELMTDLAIGKGTLGILTAVFLLAFAACLLPSGIAIDRFGPRTVQSVMMGVTALGALIFSLSTGPFGLTIGCTLLGVGSASALLAGMKAVVTWFPREHLGLVTGCLITLAGFGALAAADPAALFVSAYGWRALFILLAALATICAILAVLLVPTPATVTGDVPDQDHGLPLVLRDPFFRRFAPLAAVVVGTVWAIQGQWVAGWLAAVNGLELTDIITLVSLMAVGQTAGALVWGVLADWAVRKGQSAASVFVGAVALCLCIQVAAVGGIALPTSIVWGAFSVAGAAAMLPFVILLTHFPQAYAARACASIGVLQYVATLFIQWAIGIVVAIWPHAASGQTSATAYAMALMVPIVLQLAALAWFLFPRSETRDGAPSVGEMRRRGAARAQHQVQDLSEPPSIPGSLPADAAAAPADSAVEPADTAVGPIDTALAPTETAGETAVAVSAPAEIAETLTDTPAASASLAAEPADTAVEPIGTASAPTETAGETAVAASAPAETVEALTDTPAAPADVATEPDDTAAEPIGTALAPTETADETAEAASAPAETTVAPADVALRSILDAALSGGLGGALGTTSRASSDTPNRAALAPTTEIAQPSERELSFPLIAPSHVQALNAVHRRRPALAATIGGRQISIVVAWPPPDRRRDASHRVALRLDGESGELWLPQSLLDVLVGSVDPALSLDRLGPDRSAIILEFALDSVLAAVEMDLGCRLAVDSFSGQVERLENDGLLPLFFTLVIEGLVTTGCELRIPPDYALRLAEGLDRHAGISRSALDVPVPVCLRVAAANLAVGEIERLAPDDVVLVDATAQPGHAVIAVIGERLVAPVALAPEGHRLAAHPIPGATSPWAWSTPTDAMAAWEADAETDNRPLHVLFEIGRFELPASKVKQLAPNALLPLGPLHDQTVDIVVGGQRIGQGTLMQIGNRTGVRVTTVRERPRPA